MQVNLEYRGGPMEGVVEFDYDPKAMPEGPPSKVLAFSFFDLTDRGQVGKATQGITPAAYALRYLANDQVALGGLSQEQKTAKYVVAERTEKDGVVFVKAHYDGPIHKAK